MVNAREGPTEHHSKFRNEQPIQTHIVNKQDVIAAMVAAGLERPRVMLVWDKGPGFLLCAGPNDAGRRQTRVNVTGTRNGKASINDVANAIESLKG